jgi:predicted amidohydrolase
MSHSGGGAITGPRKVLIGALQADTGGASFQAMVNDERIVVVSEAIVSLAVQLDSSKCDFGIFVAPEYLFTHENAKQKIVLGPSGKYHSRGITEEQKEKNLEDLKSLSVLYKKIIIIAGTMAWIKPFDRNAGIDRHKPNEKDQRDPGRVLVDRRQKALDDLHDADAAALVKGYSSFTGGRAFHHSVPKSPLKESRISSDRTPYMLRNSLYVIANGEVLHKYNKIADFHEVLNRSEQKAVFVPGDAVRQTADLFGKEFGFEICLDHAYDTLGFGNQMRIGVPVDIHILLSASVDTERARMKDDGLFIHASSDSLQTCVFKKTGGNPPVQINESIPLRDVLRTTTAISMRYFETQISMTRLPGA